MNEVTLSIETGPRRMATLMHIFTTRAIASKNAAERTRPRIMTNVLRTMRAAVVSSWRSAIGWVFHFEDNSNPDPLDPLALGRRGERAAFIFLKHQGYMIVARNFRTIHGEIDMVAWDRDILCFVEVKTRATAEHGRPEDAVTPFKQRQILNTSLDYLRRGNLHAVNTRFDIVSVLIRQDGVPVCELIRHAFGSRMN